MPQRYQEVRPVPDPTELTNAAVREAKEEIRREIQKLKELIFSELNCVHRVKAEKFGEVEKRFLALETARLEQKHDNEGKINAAMAAQQTAINKQEAAVDRQLQQLKDAVDSTETDLRRSIEALDRRIGSIEGRSAGGKENMGWIAAITGVVLLLLAMMGWIASHNLVAPAAPTPVPQATK